MPIEATKFLKVSIQKSEDDFPSIKYIDAHKASTFKGFSVNQRQKIALLIAKNLEGYMLMHIYQPHFIINIITKEKISFKHLEYQQQSIHMRSEAYTVTSIFLHDSMNNGQHILKQYAGCATILHNNFCNNLYI